MVDDAGQLFADNLLVTGSTTVDSEPFGPQNIAGDITAGFTVEDNTLVWRDESFTGGIAKFCMTADNVVTVVFRGLSPPDCLKISLVALSSKSLIFSYIPYTLQFRNELFLNLY